MSLSRMPSSRRVKNGNPAGLKGTISEHTHHADNSAGSQCITCHMPKIEQTIKDNYVHTHVSLYPAD